MLGQVIGIHIADEAIVNGRNDLVEAFVRGAGLGIVSAQDPEDGQVALLIAVEAGRASTVEYLVDKAGARLDTRNGITGERVWDVVSKMKPEDPEKGRSLGRVGGRSMATMLLGLWRKHQDEYVTTPIHEAAAAGDTVAIEYLVGIGFDLWIEDRAGYNFIHIAAYNNRPNVVRRFLREQTQGNDDDSVVDRSSQSESFLPSKLPPLTDAQLANGVERRNKSSGKTPLHVAANRGHVDALAALLVCGARPSTTDASGWTALHDAAAGRQSKSTAEVVLMLLAAGLGSEDGVRAATKDGETPLHVAARHGRVAGIRALISADPGPLVVGDKDGWTPLHAAVSTKQPEVVEAVIESAVTALGPDGASRLTEISDKTGKTPRKLVDDVDPEARSKMIQLLDGLRKPAGAGDRV